MRNKIKLTNRRALFRKTLLVYIFAASTNLNALHNPLNVSFKFCPVPYIKAMDVPSVLFEFNSSKIYREKNEDQKMYDQKVSGTIARVKRIFDEETSTIIEITGHCDEREKNKKKLSQARAKYIADELIKKGINKKRIVIKGEGAEEPLIPEATIKAAQTEQEKEDLYLQNRRISIKILRWDFKE